MEHTRPRSPERAPPRVSPAPGYVVLALTSSSVILPWLWFLLSLPPGGRP